MIIDLLIGLLIATPICIGMGMLWGYIKYRLGLYN